MAEQPEGVEFSGFGAAVKLFGGNSLFFFLLILLAGNVALTIYEHVNRSKEHEQLMCSNRLAIFVYTTPRQPDGQAKIDWTGMDVSLYACVPKFLYESRNVRER
jgi:hypothetical protein